MESIRSVVSHPAAKTGVATILGYTIIVGLLTLLLFFVPFVIFRFL